MMRQAGLSSVESQFKFTLSPTAPSNLTITKAPSTLMLLESNEVLEAQISTTTERMNLLAVTDSVEEIVTISPLISDLTYSDGIGLNAR